MIARGYFSPQIANSWSRAHTRCKPGGVDHLRLGARPRELRPRLEVSHCMLHGYHEKSDGYLREVAQPSFHREIIGSDVNGQIPETLLHSSTAPVPQVQQHRFHSVFLALVCGGATVPNRKAIDFHRELLREFAYSACWSLTTYLVPPNDCTTFS